MEDFFFAAGIIILIFIPALALTARFALWPIVEAIIGLSEGLIGDSSGSISGDRMAAIEGELAEIRRDMRKLTGVREFDRDLTGASDHGKLLSGRERIMEKE